VTWTRWAAVAASLSALCALAAYLSVTARAGIIATTAIVTAAAVGPGLATLRVRLTSGGVVPAWARIVPLAIYAFPISRGTILKRLALDLSTAAAAAAAWIGFGALRAPALVLLWSVLAAAFATDLTSRRLPWRLTLPAIGYAWAFAGLHVDGPQQILLALGLGLLYALGWFLIGFGPYIIGLSATTKLGFGDVVLAVSIGIVASALAGWLGLVVLFVFTGVAGGLHLLVHMVATRSGRGAIAFGPSKIAATLALVTVCACVEHGLVSPHNPIAALLNGSLL